MKNILKMSGIITIAVIMCLSFTSCEDLLDEIFYTVTFDTMTAEITAPLPQSAIKGEIIDPWGTALSLPTRANFIFDGWYTSKEFDKKWNFTTDKVIDDMTLFARWLPAVTVTFVSNNGVITIPTSSKIATGTKVTQPTSLTVIYVCDGWYKENTFVTKWDFNDPVTESMTLYGNWLASYTVKFLDGITELGSQPVLNGKKIEKPADPTKTGNNFAGWYSDITLNNAWDFDNGTVSQSMFLYAKWTVTITFDSKSGSAVAEQVITSGTKASSVSAPTKDGFTFINWYKDDALTQLWAPGTDTFSVHTTLYAKWILALDPTWYQITGSEGAFTAIKGSDEVGTGTIMGVIDAIKDDAASAACTIFFGDGENWLDIGTDYVRFIDGWGAITLKGKITSAIANNSSTSDIDGECGTITIGHSHNTIDSSFTSVTIKDADIRNTSVNTSGWGYAVFSISSTNNSSMTITDSTISVTSTGSGSSSLHFSVGACTITDTTITANGGTAITYNHSSSSTYKLTIKGSSIITSQSSFAVYLQNGNLTVEDNALISSGAKPAIEFETGTVTIENGTVTSAAPPTFTSSSTLFNQGTITLRSTSGNGSNLVINGGTVSNTHADGYAISVRKTSAAVTSNIISKITLNSGTITAPVTAINNLGSAASMITLSEKMQAPLVINGVVMPSVNTNGDGNLKIASDFNLSGIINLNYVSPVAGMIAVIDGKEFLDKFALTNAGFILEVEEDGDNLVIAAIEED